MCGTPMAAPRLDQPCHCAVIALDSCLGINSQSHLPGAAPGQAVIGSQVTLTFEATPASGQKIPEWRVI